jgi:adhesin transport system membrane fusion protein
MTEAAKTPEPRNQPQKKSAPDKKPEASMNNQADWDNIQRNWARRFETAQAHADKYFMTDEELPLRQHLLLVMIAAFVFLFILWGSFASLDEVTKGQGKVIPSSEVQVISSLEGGIVDQFFVKEGDAVKAGQPLVQLHDIQALSDLGSNRQKYLGLKAKAQRLEAEIENLPAPKFSDDVLKGVPAIVQQEIQAFRTDQQNLNSQTAVLEQELSQRRGEENEARTKISDLRGVVSLAQQHRDMTAPMVARGSAPKMELLTLEQEIKEKQTELNGYTSSLPRIQAAINEAQARIHELNNSTRAQAQTDLTATTAEMNTLAPTLNALEDRKTRTELKSPVNGTVKDMKITTVGGVVQPGQPILEIVPKDDQLIVEANVRPADIAFLYPDQPAVVKLTAYDYAIYGGLRGHVVDISADSITNEKGESFYRVRIRTDENHLTRKGEILNIIPGMVASVDIMTGKKTVMEYLLKPFIKTLRSAMRER